MLLKDGSALSTAGFITVNGDKTSLDLLPTGPSHVGTWEIWATQDTASGPNPNYLALTITVDCTITAVADPTAPSVAGGDTLTYQIFYTALEIDLSSITYPQTPLCGYTVTEVFNWNITPVGYPITESGEKITVWTTDTAKHADYTVTLTNAITHSSGTWSPSMTFVVSVVDPCRTTDINTVDVTAGISM